MRAWNDRWLRGVESMEALEVVLSHLLARVCKIDVDSTTDCLEAT